MDDIEKMMKRLMGIPCYLRHAAISKTRTLGDGRIGNDWIFFNKQVIRTDFSIV